MYIIMYTCLVCAVGVGVGVGAVGCCVFYDQFGAVINLIYYFIDIALFFIF